VTPQSSACAVAAIVRTEPNPPEESQSAYLSAFPLRQIASALPDARPTIVNTLPEATPESARACLVPKPPVQPPDPPSALTELAAQIPPPLASIPPIHQRLPSSIPTPMCLSELYVADASASQLIDVPDTTPRRQRRVVDEVRRTPRTTFEVSVAVPM
jgi:hypothetical protein